MIIADTATLIFWTLDRERLSAPAARAIAQADKIGVSSISIWEIGIKVGKGKLDLPLSIREFTDRLAQVDRVELLPVDAATWITNLELDWNHRDPADRAHGCHRNSAGLPPGVSGCHNPRFSSTDHLVNH